MSAGPIRQHGEPEPGNAEPGLAQGGKRCSSLREWVCARCGTGETLHSAPQPQTAFEKAKARKCGIIKMGKRAASSSSSQGAGRGMARLWRSRGGGHQEMLRAAQVWCCTRDLLPHLLHLLVGKEAEKN